MADAPPNSSPQNSLGDLDNKERNFSAGLGYSKFIKAMRYALPLLALALVVVVITWSEIDDQIVAIPKEDLIPTSQTIIGQTELTNPRFETVDEFNQPVLVIADKALQNQNNPDLINLSNPIADFKTENGSAMHIQAQVGTLEQKEEKLFLEHDVQIKHDEGYTLQAQELRLNMKTKQAFSGKNVTIKSDKAVINAEGLDGNMETGILIFKGPATLIIKETPQIEASQDAS